MSIQRDRRRLSGSKFENESFKGMDLRNAVCQAGSFTGCKFDHVDISQGAFGDTTFSGCEFMDCDFRQAVLVSRIYNCIFTDCNFDQVVFSGADIRESSFGGRAQYSNWSRATVVSTKLDLDMHGAILDFVASKSVDFSGSNMWGAIFPLNCATIVGNTFDKRQMHMFLALVCHTLGNDETRKSVDAITDKHEKRLVEKLVLAQCDQQS